MKKRLLIFIGIFIFSIVNIIAQSDNCSTAPAIPQTCTWYLGSNVGFTAVTSGSAADDVYAPADICAISLENTAWYTFTPTVSTTYDIVYSNLSCTGSGVVQAGILQHTGGGPACSSTATYTSLGCSSTNSTCFEIAGVSLTAGTTYYLVLDGDAGAECTWEINVCYSTCVVTPDVGTFVIDYNGTPIAGPPYSPIYLCAEGGGDCYSMTSNDDYTLPSPWGCEISEVMWLLYTGPPTGPDPALDPNYSGSMWTGEDFTDCNPSTYGLTGTVYWVPVTADDGDNGGDPNGVVHWDQDGDGCYDLGINETVQVTYLNPIAVATSSNACNGTVTLTVTGGVPEFAGGNYTVVNNSNGSLAGLPVTHNGSFQITGLTNGDGWSVTITDANGCSNTFTGTYSGDASDPSWTDPSPICASAGSINLNSLITGTAGGTWSGTGVSGNTFNPASGSQSVTYSVGPCPQTEVHTITVIPDVDPSWTSPGTICENAGSISLNPLVTGTAGGTWSGTGVTGSTFDPTGLSGNIAVTYTVGTAPCQETSVQNINVVPDVDPSWTSPGTICENAGSISLNPLVTGTAGGTWSGTGVTGSTFDPTGLSGNIAVTYTVGTAPCQETSVQNINVVPDVDPSWTSPGTICENAGSISLNPLVTGTAGGTWSGTGVTGSTFDPTGLSGNIAVTYTVGTAPCQETSVQNINVVPDVDPSWTSPGTICENAGSISLNPLVTGTAGGTWSGTGVTGSTFDPTGLSGNIAVTYTVGTAPCQETSVQNINVVPDVDPSWTSPGTICENAGSISLNPLVTGTAGGTWSGTGVTGSTFDPTGLSGNIAVTYTVGTAPCQETSVQNINVVPDVDPSWTSPGTICENAGSISLNPLVTGTAGGTWSGTGVTGSTFDPTGLSGNIAVTYTVGTAPCQETSVQNINVVPDVDPTWTNPGPLCEGSGSINLNSQVTGTAGGTWSGTGVSGNTFDPTGLSGFINVTYTVGTAPCQESLMLAIQVDPEDDASFSYSSGTYCVTGADPAAIPGGTQTPGGTYTITAPGVINASNGTIDLSASGTGSYTVTYNTFSAGNPCPDTATFNITITNAPSAAFSYDQAQYCQYDPAPVLTYGAGASGGVFSSSPAGLGLNTGTGAIDLTTSTPGLYTVYNNIAAAGGCAAAVDSTTIEVLPSDSALFSYSPTSYCESGVDPIAVLGGNATAGGTFTITAPGVINAGDGTIDLDASGTGTFTVYYNTTSAGNPCPAVDSVTITITPAPDAAFSYDQLQYCQDSAAPVLTLGPGATAGAYSSTPAGLALNSSTGAVDLVNSTPGLYTVYNTIAAAGGCAMEVDSTTIEVLPVDSAAFSYPSNTFCVTGSDPIAVLGGNTTAGGTFTITAPGVINAGDGTIDLSASGLGTYTVYYNTASVGNPCPEIDSVTINIVSAPGATFTYNTPFCEGDTSVVLPTFAGNNFPGVFSANPAGVSFVDTLTGEIDLTSSTAGTYMVYNNLAASGGCAAALDSFQIVINPMFVVPQNTAICEGDSILLGGSFQTAAGVYNDTLSTINGCDSIIQTTLTINPVDTMPQNAAICQGDSILLGGSFQTTAGIYYDTLSNANGCDSILVTTLTINSVITVNVSDSICQGDSLFVGGAWQTTAGVYNDTSVAVGGCDSVTITTLTVNPQLSIVAMNDTTICSSGQLILSAVGSGSGTIEWYSDAGLTSFEGNGSPLVLPNPGNGVHMYYVIESGGACPSNVDSVQVTVGGVVANINATPTTGSIPLDVNLDGTGSTGSIIGYSWDFGDGNSSTQATTTNTYTDIGTYTVTLIVTDGTCFDTTTVIIDAFGESVILIPNVFTPNNDGQNDVFTIDGENLESVEVEIYNRWGQLMYQWDNVKGYWDGRTLSGSEAPDGTYFYIVNAKGFDGAEYFKKGGFSLIR